MPPQLALAVNTISLTPCDCGLTFEGVRVTVVQWGMPAVHVPFSQYSLVPHEVPFGALPVSLHAGTPLEQLMIPAWQIVVGVHDAPAVQALHDPLSQTSFEPHVVPLAPALAPLS